MIRVAIQRSRRAGGRWCTAALSMAGLVIAPSGCLSPESDSAIQALDPPAVEVERYTLGNGLEVILAEDHRLPLVAVNVWYHVGPANEEPGRTGFAHLFEHMMFQGSRHVPGDSHFRLLEAAGASELNGTTNLDRTSYYETVPSDQLELALWLESDRMGFLLGEVDQAKLANQQDVVRNERRQRVESQAYGLADEALYHTLFPEGHPYYANVIGSHADIQAARLGDVQAFFERYYAPSNATVAIVGDIVPEETRALVDRYFGTLRTGEPVGPPDVVTPPITSERRVSVEVRAELPRLYMAWLTPPAFQPGDAEAEITEDLLAGGRWSRLEAALVYERQIAQDISVSNQSLSLGSIFRIQATARPGRTLGELEDAIDRELEALRATPPQGEEVDRARNAIETQIVRGLERLGGLADRLNLYNHYVGVPGYVESDLLRYEAVTPASIQEFVQAYLSADGRVVVHAVPGEPRIVDPATTAAEVTTEEGAAELSEPDEPWRGEPPPRGATGAPEIPVPQSFELPNGLIVLVNERPDVPIVSASLVVRRGGAENPIDRPGLAAFTTTMLDQGTSTREALQISEEVAGLGASLSARATMDAMSVTGSSLRRVFPSLLAIMTDVALNPTFPSEELERERERRLVSLVRERDNAVAVVEKSVFRSLYGPRHPYGYRDLGTETAIRDLTRDEVQQFWSTHFVPANSALVVSGQITVDELRPLVEEGFGEWISREVEPSAFIEPTTTGARLVLVDRPGALQSQVRVASIGVPRSTPDYDAIVLLNAILGGLFSSRVNLSLREERGYTYGAFSQFVFRRNAGPFYIGAAVRTDATAAAVEEIFREVHRIRDELVSADELELARDSQIRSLVARYQTSRTVTTNTANLFVQGLPLDYYSGIGARFFSVTPDKVRAAARQHLDPDGLIVVVVGDLAVIRAPLEALSLGSVEIRDEDGTLVR